MLNPALPKAIVSDDTYVLPENIVKRVVDENSQTNTFSELRLSEVYTEEIWRKLKSLSTHPDDFKNKRVLDLCAGTGFLTYHILKRAQPLKVDLIDLSSAEILQAKKLLKNSTNIHFIVGDVQNQSFNNKYDIVIGNSFMHHLYDIPSGIQSFKSYLKPGGTFIVLHEPTIMAPFVESASLPSYLRALYRPAYQLDTLRPTSMPGALKIPSGDVWIFKPGDMSKMLNSAGFESIIETKWHLARPWVVARNRIHLTPAHKALTTSETRNLLRSIKLDTILRKFLPARFWGSVAVKATK